MTPTIEPWELFPDIWKSEASYFTWLRGQIRKIWSLYPAKLKWKSSQLFLPPEDYSGRAKKLGICFYCKKPFAASHLEVDHQDRAGSCNSWDTAYQFLYNLLKCDDEAWVLSCKPCHKIKSHSESRGVSFEQAEQLKHIIRIMKIPVDKLSEILYSCGYGKSEISNAKKRKQCIDKEIAKGNLHLFNE